MPRSVPSGGGAARTHPRWLATFSKSGETSVTKTLSDPSLDQRSANITVDDAGTLADALSDGGWSCTLTLAYGTGSPVSQIAGDVVSAENNRGLTTCRVTAVPASLYPAMLVDTTTGFNHLPQPGTKIATASGVVVLQT